MGAAPVPVPPPIPAVKKTISAPFNTALMRSRSSSAERRPTSGLAPAPNPRVILSPNCKSVVADEFFNACASVFAQINSTPSIEAAIICSTALPPPPPIPITLITAFCTFVSDNSNI